MILDTLEVKELTESFTVKLPLRKEWFDQRLTFKHLKRNPILNKLLKSESEAMRYPFFEAINIKEV